MKRWVMILLVAAMAACGGEKAAKPPEPVPAAPPPKPDPLERAKIHTELGVSYFDAGRPAIALQEFSEALEAKRDYAPAYGGRALVYMDLGEDAQAERDFKQALRLDPNSSETKNNYGLFLCQRGRGSEGLKLLLQAVKNPLYETPDIAYKNAGLCAQKMGDLQAAEDSFRRALKFNPSQPQALYAMAEISFARGDLSAARDFLRRYVRAVPAAGPEALWLGARIERRLGDRTAMMSYGDQLRRRFPGSAETRAFMEGRFE
jgi:type IV pilus assembly protein PilF